MSKLKTTVKTIISDLRWVYSRHKIPIHLFMIFALAIFGWLGTAFSPHYTQTGDLHFARIFLVFFAIVFLLINMFRYK